MQVDGGIRRYCSVMSWPHKGRGAIGRWPLQLAGPHQAPSGRQAHSRVSEGSAWLARHPCDAVGPRSRLRPDCRTRMRGIAGGADLRMMRAMACTANRHRQSGGASAHLRASATGRGGWRSAPQTVIQVRRTLEHGVAQSTQPGSGHDTKLAVRRARQQVRRGDLRSGDIRPPVADLSQCLPC